jgi:hypothetical protein
VNPFKKTILLLTELGPAQLADNLLYRLQLRSGYLARQTPAGSVFIPPVETDFSSLSLFSFDWVKTSKNINDYIVLADEVVSGMYRPFGGNPASLDLTLPQPLQHWSKYGDSLDGKDIKQFWEPARFTWVLPLCTAYTATNKEKYSAAFWKYLETFLQNNPVTMGPNWSSAQEVALRLIPWVMAGQVFANSPESTPERKLLLSIAIWQHCQRIPPTLRYARSQHNNHLLSEALGLLLGGWLFRDTTVGKRWLELGNKEFQRGVLKMVEADGTFSQHSNNYHRLLLQLALIHMLITEKAGLDRAPLVNDRLAQATKWLTGQLDTVSGKVPNLGHNDGSNLLPIGCEYSDYRPVIQAANRAFLGSPCLAAGNWDDLSASLKLIKSNERLINPSSISTSAIHRIGNDKVWASLRACRFHSRPAHADMLHTEVWFAGENIAVDAGTYAYNLPEPWNNSLMRTSVHNTIMVAGQDQMLRAGKFLWLQRPNVKLLISPEGELAAKADFRTLIPYTHIRKLKFLSHLTLEVIDTVSFQKKGTSPQPVTIQWLLPDWPWRISENSIEISSKSKLVTLEVTAVSRENLPIKGEVSLIHAGKTLFGFQNDPIRGWVSETYLAKSPALSLAIEFMTSGELQIKTFWRLHEK